MNIDWNVMMLWLVSVAGTALAAALTWVSMRYRVWIVQKIKSDRLEGILLRLGQFVYSTVMELNQTVVAQLKADQKWNAEEAAKVRDLAVDKIMSYLGVEGVKEAMDILGLDNAGLRALIISLIETHVLEAKQS